MFFVWLYKRGVINNTLRNERTGSADLRRRFEFAPFREPLFVFVCLPIRVTRMERKIKVYNTNY